MQAESSKNTSNFPSIEFFLSEDDYDSDDFDFDFLKYDLIEKKLDEEQDEDEEVDDIDVIVDDEDDIVIEDDDVIVEYEGDVKIKDETNNNLQKRKRKRSKKILLQTDIDKLRNKLHANKYFIEEITPELVRCKCGKEIRLDRKFRDKILQHMVN